MVDGYNAISKLKGTVFRIDIYCVIDNMLHFESIWQQMMDVYCYVNAANKKIKDTIKAPK